MRDPGGTGQPGSDLERDYYQATKRAVEDDDSIEAYAPLMWSWAKDAGPPTKIDFSSVLDEKAIEHRTEALESIARGLNYPQRLLVDGGDSTNHWGAWLLQETFAKEAVAPKLERIVWGDITETFFRPMLRALAAQGLFRGNPDEYRVGFDMTPIVVHPDQSKTALELYKLGTLSDKILLSTSGFDDTAAPDRDELARWIARTQIMRESIRPQTTQVMPTEANTVLEETPAGPPDGTTDVPMPGQTAALGPVLDANSTVREAVLVGPMVGEEHAWLDE
jgi:hypothetical protein